MAITSTKKVTLSRDTSGNIYDQSTGQRIGPSELKTYQDQAKAGTVTISDLGVGSYKPTADVNAQMISQTKVDSDAAINANIADQKAAGKTGQFYSAPTGEYTTKAYDANNNVIYVKSGEYVAGASLTPKGGINGALMSGNPNENLGYDTANELNKGAPTDRNGATALSKEEQDKINLAASYRNMASGTEAAPEAPKLAEMEAKLKSGELAGGVYKTTELEEEVNNLSKIIKDNEMRLRTTLGLNENQPIPLSVIQGRNNEAYNTFKKNVQVYQDQLTLAQNQLKDKQTAIDNYIKYTDMDYDNAKQKFDEDYKRAWDSIMYVDKQMGAEAEAAQAAKKDAAAQWTAYSNLFKDGNLTYDALDEATKLKITDLELKAGYPVGTLAAIKNENPNGKLLGSSTNDAGDVTFTFLQPNGDIKTLKVAGAGKKTKATGDGSGSVAGGQLYDTYRDKLMATVGADGKVNTEAYKRLRTEWGAIKNHSITEFDSLFKDLGNMDDPTFVSALSTSTQAITEEKKLDVNNLLVNARAYVKDYESQGLSTREAIRKVRDEFYSKYPSLIKEFEVVYPNK